ncbi:MAG: hypothetical protein WD928_05145 [Gammaproteobacteria bacterium]
MAENAGKSDLIGMSVYLRHQTDRAVLVDSVNSTREPAWVPLSQVELTPNGDGETYWLDIPEWLAVEKGLL